MYILNVFKIFKEKTELRKQNAAVFNQNMIIIL